MTMKRRALRLVRWLGLGAGLAFLIWLTTINWPREYSVTPLETLSSTARESELNAATNFQGDLPFQPRIAAKAVTMSG